ncbi:ABC transporter permease [Cytobacillus oceanisediminis]|jgi:D-methionine transport system permease protein|uniref:ABC transporter permease n=2 Tax=Niallia TaxID=2837506 RepID=A0A941GQI9_NIACI|nr:MULTISPECIES: methionine ABC transporter permease [Bacillaceae]EOR25827.1 binding-protein-dependent transport system inner membrane protein [Niallia nealsonii AAU1]MDU1844680.1 methionine ABC transporter permease [Niallia nealsonii]MBZ9533781.1 ABC transporter permease [Cytobacillus oceanisediminis]MCB5239966.1 ABC transporter permease [Niallia circulans]NMO79958.1 ABC transporter permease [Niallia alba]
MPEILVQYRMEIWQSIGQTFIMVGMSILAAIIIGLPVGTLLFLSRKGKMLENPIVFSTLNLLVNIIRSFPFLLLVVFLIPFTRIIIGTAIGTAAATVPLSIIAIAHYSRLVEQSLLEVPKGVIEAAISMGASVREVIFKFLYVEARSGLVLGLTTSIISFISYSTIMGVVGGGGIGDFAIRYGYQQFKTDLMIYMIIIMVILVQAIQFTGTAIAKVIDKR